MGFLTIKYAISQLIFLNDSTDSRKPFSRYIMTFDCLYSWFVFSSDGDSFSFSDIKFSSWIDWGKRVEGFLIFCGDYDPLTEDDVIQNCDKYNMENIEMREIMNNNFRVL